MSSAVQTAGLKKEKYNKDKPNNTRQWFLLPCTRSRIDMKLWHAWTLQQNKASQQLAGLVSLQMKGPVYMHGKLVQLAQVLPRLVPLKWLNKGMLAKGTYCEEVVNHLLSSKHGNTNLELTTALFQKYATLNRPASHTFLAVYSLATILKKANKLSIGASTSMHTSATFNIYNHLHSLR